MRPSHRVIADHLRASSFLIADGVLPSNEGRGYVLRRIMRRAMRHAHILGAKEPLMCRLVPALVARDGPRLSRARCAARALITETLKLEETRFRETLERGLACSTRTTEALKRGDTLAGEVAFKLYDTYGFPLDLTAGRAASARASASMREGFDAAMERQRAEAREVLGRLRRGRDRGDLVRAEARSSAPPSSSATRPKRAEGEIVGAGQGRRAR